MPDETENSEGKQSKPWLFQPGQSGNPAGKPKGARTKLAEHFLDDVYTMWKTDGAAILQKARDEKPMEFAKMVAGLLPRDTLVRVSFEDEMSDEQLADTIGALEHIAAHLRNGGERPKPTHEGTGTA